MNLILRTDLYKQAQNIAARLSATLRVNNDAYITRGEMDYCLTLPDGVGLFVHVGGYSHPGRMHISGDWPKYMNSDGHGVYMSPRDCGSISYCASTPDITVAVSKTSEQIVKDIQRRLLPSLVPIWHKCREYIINKERGDKQRAATVYRLALATSGAAHVKQDGASVSYNTHYARAEHRGGWSATDPETFKLSLDDVSEAQVIAIMALLKEGQQ